MQEGWIRVVTLKPSHLGRMLRLQIHAGEAEAIALASEVEADLLIDEREGRKLAEQAGLKVTGTLGVLLRAKQMGAILAVKPEIRALRERAGFFLSAGLQARVLASAGE